MRNSRIGWKALCAVVLLACVSWSAASAQQAPWRVVQGSDGTLYLVTGDTRYVITPDQITDDDMAALTDGGTLGSQLPMPPVPTAQVITVIATAQPLAAIPTSTPTPDAQATRIAVGTVVTAAIATAAAAQPTPVAPSVGTRENPVPMGAVAHFVSGWDVVVVGKTPDATNIVLKQNQFNSSPKPGQQFFIGRVQATYGGPGSQKFDRASLTAVGNSSVAYTTFGNSCGVYPDSLTENETFSGGVIVGNVCWAIRSEDTSSLVMYDSSFATRSESRVFLSLH
jgi:hypothetical protein